MESKSFFLGYEKVEWPLSNFPKTTFTPPLPTLLPEFLPMAETPKQGEEEARNKPPKDPTPPPSIKKALSFWFYFTISISLLTLLLLPFLRRTPTATSFLRFPDHLRRHYSAGRLLKIQPFELFVADSGASASAETVLLLHGLGSSSFSFRRVLPALAGAGLRAVAVDLPGSGFSDRPPAARSWLLDTLAQMRENGVFWAFDQLVETGEIPLRADAGGLQEPGSSVGKVLDEMSIGKPVHLVLHDSALAASASWVSANARRVRSVTLLDTPVAELPAFPSQFLQVPALGSLLLKSRFMFAGLLRMCCSRTVGGDAAEAYRLLIAYEDGKRAVVEAGKGLNRSFDLGEWARSEEMKGIAIQVLWSSMWSDRWIEEGRRVASTVPEAQFVWHSGGRWPQEDDAEEISELIVQFVSSLPKSITQSEEDHLQDRTEQELGEDNYNHAHDHGYGHDDVAGYASTYGRGQEWGY
ncbi:protein AUXIN RESPONSE 4 isoform X1 [Iris pallida]|uniref:Protein AUXIN RESPONSE 4 isoform X1 n=1 Tax=Iris pallida TaxID=29817 RepID=A0AAX6EQ86_IRIPA|nr:protein AUXIN RESPONSE 4 isoform X1 [Iris pallida]